MEAALAEEGKTPLTARPEAEPEEEEEEEVEEVERPPIIEPPPFDHTAHAVKLAAALKAVHTASLVEKLRTEAAEAAAAAEAEVRLISSKHPKTI